MSKACSEYRAHAYVQNKCRDCMRPESEHVKKDEVIAASSTATTPSNASEGDVSPGTAHANAFEHLDAANAAGVLAENCTHYNPHAWIFDRCRDCGLTEASHKTSDLHGDKPTEESAPRRGSMLVRKESIVNKANVKEASEMKEVGQLDVKSTPAPMSPSQIKAWTAEESMKHAVAKMMLFEKEFEKISSDDEKRLRNKEISQSDYDKSVKALRDAFQKKESEMRIEIENARKALEDANAARQKEVEENAARQIAEAQAAARKSILETENSTRELLAAAEKDRAEAMAMKKEAEALRAQAEEEAKASREAKGAAEKDKEEAEKKRIEAEEQLKIAQERIIVAATVLPEAAATDDDLVEEQPAAPAPMQTAVSKDGTVQLSDVLRNAERLFQHGRNVVRYQADSVPKFIAVFIRELTPRTDAASSEGKKAQYSLCWCKADERNVHVSRTLDFSEITAVVLGKQTAVLKSANASHAVERNCVSFIAQPSSKKKSLHLQFGNARDADTYAYGIASLMKEYGSKPQIYELGTYSEGRIEASKDLAPSVEFVEEDDGSKPVEQKDLDSIASMNQPNKYKIEISCKCANLPSEHQNTIVCLVDRNERTNKLEYLNQTEKVSKTLNPVFKKKFPLVFVDTSAKTLRFNVYDCPDGVKNIEDDFRLGSAIVSIKSLVDRPGAEFVYELSHKHPKRNEKLKANTSTLTVSCTSKSQIGGGETEESKAAKAQLKGLEKTMSQGDTFTNYLDGADPVQVTLFYSAGTPPANLTPTQLGNAEDRFDLGNLNWASIGAQPQSLSLRTIVDVFVGKKATALKIFRESAKEDHCFSLVSKLGVRLDLEAKSKAIRDEWVSSIISFLKAAAAQSQKDKAAVAASNAAPATSSSAASPVPAK